MKREDMEADNKRLSEAQAQKRHEFEKRYSFLERQHRDRMADLAARRKIMAERNNKPEVDKATAQLIKEAKGRKDKVRGEIANIKAAIESAKADPNWGGFDREEKLAKLHSELTGKESEAKELNLIVSEYEAIQRKESGASPDGRPTDDDYNKAVQRVQSRLDNKEISQAQANELWRRIKAAAGR